MCLSHLTASPCEQAPSDSTANYSNFMLFRWFGDSKESKRIKKNLHKCVFDDSKVNNVLVFICYFLISLLLSGSWMCQGSADAKACF